MPELDISASANEVVALLQQGQARQAAIRLDALRQNQSIVVQEALDRYVATRAATQLANLRQPSGVSAADVASVQPMLGRMAAAMRPPRFPPPEETESLSQAQQHDVYASIVSTRGNDAARVALTTQDRVILGLRNESHTIKGQNRDRTFNQSGTGVYDDRIVVLWTDADGSRRAREFNTATTEPTAQYDHHAGSDGNRIYADTGRQAAHLGSAAGYQDVTRRKVEGDDVNGDGVRDLGRLAEGTTEMLETTHPRNRQPEFSLRPTPEAVAAGANRVERDTNADGWFDARDTQGVHNLNNTFKIHRGSAGNTDSAGCQTIGGSQYGTFIDIVRGTSGQNRWQYVLTSVTPDHARLPTLTLAYEPLDPANDPRHPQHADNAQLQQINVHLQALGGRYAEHAETYSLALLHDAKTQGATRVDQIVISNATGTRTEGETLFLVQGNPGDPTARRIPVSAADLAEISIETSLLRLQQPNVETLTPAASIHQQEAPTIGGR